MTEGPDPSEPAPGGDAPGDDAPTVRHDPIDPPEPVAPETHGADAPGAPDAGTPPDAPIAPPLVPPGGDDLPSVSSAPAPVAAPLRPPSATAPVVAPPPGPPIPLVATRQLLSTSFDLLTRSGNDLRRASFYAGAITLGTVGPLVLGALILDAEGVFVQTGFLGDEVAGPTLALVFLAWIAFVGLLVAVAEGRNLAFMVLGGRMVERPVTTRQALARSRRIFWPSVGAAFVVGLVIGVAQAIAQAFLDGILVEATQVGVIVSTLVAAVIGAPFAYVLAGVVLGDVGPIEAIRRSFRVYGARRGAAVVIVLFESIAFLLVVLGLEAGLDLVLRVVETLGIGISSGPLGLVLTVTLVVAVVFAFGTLLFTVYALTVAPQVVMFLGLTHATIGLDLVRPGGRDDPAARRPGHKPFRWFTIGMVIAFVLAALGLVGIVSYAIG